MDGDTDENDELFEDAVSGGERNRSNSGSSESSSDDPSPPTWEAPEMSQTMKNRFGNLDGSKKLSGRQSGITSEFVKSFSRFSLKAEGDIKENQTVEETAVEVPELREKSPEDDSSNKKVSFHEKLKLFENFGSIKEQPIKKEKACSPEKDSGSNISQEMPAPVASNSYSSENNYSDSPYDVKTESKDSPFIDTNTAKSRSEQLSTPEPKTEYTQPVDLQPQNVSEQKLEYPHPVPQQKSDDLHEQGRSSPQQQTNQGHPYNERDVPSPWPQKSKNQHYPGPMSAHGWPGTPAGTDVKQLYNQRPHVHQPVQPQPYPQPGMPQPTEHGNMPHPQLQQLPPEWVNPYYPHPPYGYPYPGQGHPQGYPTGQGHHTGEGQHPQSHPPKHGSPSPNSKHPSKKTPTGKGDNSKQTPSGKGDNPGGATPKQPGKKGAEGKGKATPNKEAQKNQGPKVAKKPTPEKKKPGKFYLCVDGIDPEQSTDTLINYMESRSRGEVIIEESLRTAEEPEHAVLVFEDRIEVNDLERACKKKKLGNSNLEFEELVPPKSVVASSDDDKFTAEAFKDYLSNKKKLDVARATRTEDGAISAKLKSESGVPEVLKDPNPKISGCKVCISVMYNCSHGTYWNKSLHSVSIPPPFKAPVSDSDIKPFLVNIQSVCNEQLEQHHARLIMRDELHIECTISPQDRNARQKVKGWRDSVQKAWEEFVKNGAKKRELKIGREIKDSLMEHVNKTKQQHNSEDLYVISPDESGNMKIIFIGKTTVVENFYDQISAKKSEIEELQKRKNKMTTDSIKVKPLELALMRKLNKLEKLEDIAPDFSFKVDEEAGNITFNGVADDIPKAKVIVFEAKKDFLTWKIDTLTSNQCKLLQKNEVIDLVRSEFASKYISIEFSVQSHSVDVCTEHSDQREIENVFKGVVLEDSIALDDGSKVVLSQDEWADKMNGLINAFQNICIIDDSVGDRIVVAATSSVLDDIVDEIDTFVKEHSIFTDRITIPNDAVYRFLKQHCKDQLKDLEFRNSNQKLKIDFENNPLKISGTKIAIQKAQQEINQMMSQIDSQNHRVTKAGVDSLFSDSTKAQSIICPVEEDSETIITVGQNMDKRTPFPRRSGPKQTDEDYANDQAFKNYRRDTKQKKKGGYAAPTAAGPVVFKNKTTVTIVKKEDLGKQRADVIICSTNGQLDLSGPAGKSIVNGAGPQILTDLKAKYTEGIKHGELAVVNGYNLKCKEVYLAALPSWSPGGEKVIAQSVNRSLLQAAKYKSIVFPALGTGNFHYPRDLVARTMYDCVSKFDQNNSSLKDIRFLCYDPETIRVFEQEEMSRANPGYVPLPTGGTGPFKKNNMTVKLVKGDLGSLQLDILVAASGTDLKLESSGGAGISLMKGLNPTLQNDIDSQHPNGVTSGGFAAVKLSLPKGKCKYVYLTSLSSWDSEKKIPKDEDKQICKFVYQCLEMADKNGCTSIGIPAMGTGKIGYPHHLVASYMFKMADKFATKHKTSRLTNVQFVLHQTDSKTIRAFESEEQNWVPRVTHQPTPKGAARHSGGDQAGTSDITVRQVSDQEFKVGDIKLTVEQGDILSKSCDAIINGCSEDMDLTGAVSNAIKKKCNAKQLDAECAKKSMDFWSSLAVKNLGYEMVNSFLSNYSSQPLDILYTASRWGPIMWDWNSEDDMKQYNVVSTSSCGLTNCKHIIHVATKNSPHGWKKVIKSALKKAERKQYQSIAFPAIGTGGNSSIDEQMGTTIMEALVEFARERNSAHLQHVYLVIFQEKMVKNMLKGVRAGGQSSGHKAKPVVVTSDEKKKSSVSFTIFYLKGNNFIKAKKLLEKAIEDKYTPEKIHDNVLTECGTAEIEFLKSIGDGYPIEMSIDISRGDVILEGLIDEVMAAKQEVYDALRKFAHARHCKAEAEIIQDQVQWFFKDIGNTGLPELVAYPVLINMYLETAYKGESGRTEVEFKDDQGEDYVIVLKDMTECLKKDRSNKVDVIRREKLKGGAGSFEPPPEWDEQGTDNIKVIPLQQSSLEFQSVQKKFIDSVFSGRPEWRQQFNKSTLTVTKIERVQNASLYQMYAAKKMEMESQNPSGTKNEMQLWHGTPESAVVSINYYGFNRSYCRDNSKDAYWGEGVYFSADASYSARGWLASGNPTGEHNIYLCNVLTGVSTKGQRGMRYLPMRPDGTMLNYNSATDTNYNPTVEYVIFNDTQAYPSYCIKFKY